MSVRVQPKSSIPDVRSSEAAKSVSLARRTSNFNWTGNGDIRRKTSVVGLHVESTHTCNRQYRSITLSVLSI